MPRYKGAANDTWRCDRCKKWVKVAGCDMVLPPGDDNGKYAVCLSCSDKYDVQNWKAWMTEQENQKTENKGEVNMENIKVLIEGLKVKPTYRANVLSATSRALTKAKKEMGKKPVDVTMSVFEKKGADWTEIEKQEIKADAFDAKLKELLDELGVQKQANAATQAANKPDKAPKAAPTSTYDFKNQRVKEAFEAKTLTENEAKTLDYMIESLNYGEWDYSSIQVDDIATSLDANLKSVKGYVGSLTKKGYIYSHDWGTADPNAAKYTLHLKKAAWALCDKFTDEDDKNFNGTV